MKPIEVPRETPKTDAEMAPLIKKSWIIFIALLVFTLILEVFMHPHAEFEIEGTPIFHAWYGFATCALIVLFSKFLGVFLKRKETYYGDSNHDGH